VVCVGLPGLLPHKQGHEHISEVGKTVEQIQLLAVIART
jgi:hypothetical protein